MKIKGRAHIFGNDINTDEIIPTRYLSSTDPEELGRHCMEGARKNFSSIAKKGDIIVAGKNFGCGSSREHAQLSIKGCGIGCVIAESFARIFYRNAINIGLVISECKDAHLIKEGDQLEIDLGKTKINNITQGCQYSSAPFPSFMRDIIKAGGLLKWIKHTK